MALFLGACRPLIPNYGIGLMKKDRENPGNTSQLPRWKLTPTQKGPPRKSKGTTFCSGGWKGASNTQLPTVEGCAHCARQSVLVCALQHRDAEAILAKEFQFLWDRNVRSELREPQDRGQSDGDQ
jgi:hypothetical protein